MKVTIRDVANRAGVSTGAVSYALNGKPGVSDQTRARVLEVAAELGWEPNLAARSLSGSPVGAIGLVLARPARMLGVEPFYMEFVSGIEQVIAPRGFTLMLHVVADQTQEILTYQKWCSQARVDAVLLVDLHQNDPRIEAIKAMGMTAVAISSRRDNGGLPVVWTDEASAIREAMEYLVGLGHERIARVSGMSVLECTHERDQAFAEAAASLGVAAPRAIHTDFTGEAGARATRELLTGPNRPTAIAYGNDIMAVAGLTAASELGLRVPDHSARVVGDEARRFRSGSAGGAGGA